MWFLDITQFTVSAAKHEVHLEQTLLLTKNLFQVIPLSPKESSNFQFDIMHSR